MVSDSTRSELLESSRSNRRIDMSFNFLDSAEIFEYTDCLGSDLSHIRVTYEIDRQRRVRGFGSGLEKQEALQKAVSELVERAVFSDFAAGSLATSSNGFACHHIAEISRQNAICELIERDVVMSNWLLRISPFWLKKEQWLPLADAATQEHDIRLQREGCNLKFGLWGTANDRIVLVSTLTSQDNLFGLSFSATCIPRNSITFAFKKLVSDQRRAFSIIKTRLRAEEAPFISLLSDQIRAPEDHREYYLNPQNMDSIAWFFRSNADISNREYSKISVLDIPTPSWAPWNLFVARATSPHVQPYFSGRPRPSVINFKRLGIPDGSFLKLNQDPHPLP